MFKRIMFALAIVGALTVVAGTPQVASAHWGHRGYYGRWHGPGYWGGRYWAGRPIVYPPVVYGGYYPASYYYARPYYRPYYGGYYVRPYYGSGIVVSVGW
jgi:hypothetical protein